LASEPSKKRDATPSLATSVLWNWATLALTLLVTFLQSPFVVRSLGDRRYGTWVLLGSLAGYLGLLDFGVRGAVTRYVAWHHATGADAAASKLVSTAVMLFSALGFAAVLLAVAGAALLARLFNISPADLYDARVVIVISGLTVAASLVGGAFGGVIAGLQRFDRAGQIELCSGLVRAAAVYFVLAAGLGLVALAMTQFVVSLGRAIASYWCARTLYPDLRLNFQSWDASACREIASFSGSTTLLSFAGSIVFYSDSIVAAAFLPVSELTFLAIAGNLVEYARSIIRGLTYALTPRASALGAQGNQTVIPVLAAAARIATLLMLPVAVTFLLRGDQFIGLWMGARYAQPAGLILRIFSLSLVFMATGQVLYSSLIGLNLHKGLVRFNLIEAVANIALSVILVQSIGLPGIAWGTTLPSLVMSFVVLPWYAHRTIDLAWTTYYWNAWVRPFLASVPFIAGTIVVARFWPGATLLSYFAGVCAALPLAAAGYWIIALDRPERRAALAAIGRHLPAKQR
jgi:O-antigen/teichoic acid export membrane protein